MYKKKLFMLKVDFEKAFDSLSWSFLDSTMMQMGFSIKQRQWMRACLNLGYTSVLVNGSPTLKFKIERGLRQGDLLSLILFILSIEALNVVLTEAKNKNLFKGVKVGKDKVEVSHFQFANDALIIGEWSLMNIKNLSRILSCFHLASGLKVNFNKSKLFGLGVTNVDLHSFAMKIGCLSSTFPWVYFFSTFKAPKSIINKLECIRRKFFWGGSLDSSKIAWIAWDKVISPLNKGGLGVGSLWVSNLGLIAKWWWRFLNERDSLWCKVIHSIHGPHGGLLNASSIRCKSGPWYHIAKLKDDFQDYGIDLPSLFKKKIGNGESTSFWLDKWLGGPPLCHIFPRLFRLEVNKECLVCDRCPSVIPLNIAIGSSHENHTTAWFVPPHLGSIVDYIQRPNTQILPPGLHFN
ncbi:putative RNA-directed DNA polymerase, eukaryota, reverse transcriptase zinc-binding domain protein [Tanacetum coccineum]